MHATQKKIVILGAGFGGVYAFHELHKKYHNDPSVRISIINKTDYFLFTPLLHEVATGGVSRENVMFNIHTMFDACLAELVEAEVQRIDVNKKIIATSKGMYPYDILVYALGAGTNFFTLSPEARARVYPLKTIDDAMAIKARMKEVFEREAHPSIAVVGGGPTGVEVVAEVREYAAALKKSFDCEDTKKEQLFLVDAGPRLLPHFHKDLGARARSILEKWGVRVVLNESVADARNNEVILKSGKRIPAHMVLWTAGVTANHILFSPALHVDAKNRIVVKATLQAPHHPELFVVGDAASVHTNAGMVPMTAQAAFAAGTHAARNIGAFLEKRALQPFHYRHAGDLFSLGQWLAGAEVFGFRFFGHIAWFLWRAIYLSKIIGIRNKVMIMVEWTLNIFLPRDINN